MLAYQCLIRTSYAKCMVFNFNNVSLKYQFYVHLTLNMYKTYMAKEYMKTYTNTQIAIGFERMTVTQAGIFFSCNDLWKLIHKPIAI